MKTAIALYALAAALFLAACAHSDDPAVWLALMLGACSALAYGYDRWLTRHRRYLMRMARRRRRARRGYLR